jgi:hypothetical protein
MAKSFVTLRVETYGYVILIYTRLIFCCRNGDDSRIYDTDGGSKSKDTVMCKFESLSQVRRYYSRYPIQQDSVTKYHGSMVKKITHSSNHCARTVAQSKKDKESRLICMHYIK